MAATRIVGFLVLLAASTISAGTRIPAVDALAQAAALALAVLTLAIALTATARPTWRWTSPTLFIAGSGQLLLPTNASATLNEVPVWVAPLALATAFHLFFLQGQVAPSLANQERSRINLLPHIPFLLLAFVLVAAPIAYALLLPDRIASAYELHSPLAPFLPLIFATTVLLLIGLAREAVGWIRRPPVEETEAQTPATNAQGEAA